jgi:N-acetylmuramoyl-L-alanine amidase
LAFQDSYGLKTTGECDDHTWSALIETSWTLGERLLFLRSPNIRGDDVAEVQSLLNRLGFDCGRVDGIFGPLLVRAISDFQLNVGVEGNGICTPELVSLLHRMSLQTGSGPGIAVVREGIELETQHSSDNARIVIGYFHGGTAIAHAVVKRAKENHPLTATVDSDSSAQAQTANRFLADVYVGFEVGDESLCTLSYYEVPTFVSVGGRNLAKRIAGALKDRAPELSIQLQGVRHPILRETRMPAVLCSMGPTDIVSLKTSAIAAAVSDAIDAWRADPTVEI